MNKHVEKAMEYRDETNLMGISNCAETIGKTYAEELGISEGLAAAITTNYGAGMKMGSVCGAVTTGLMILGAKGVTDPGVIREFIQRMQEKHGGLIDCKALLRANAEAGGARKTHCDGMIRDAILLIDELTERK